MKSPFLGMVEGLFAVPLVSHLSRYTAVAR